MKLFLLSLAVVACLVPSIMSAPQCATVAPGDFYCSPPTLGFNGATDWSTKVTFNENCGNYVCTGCEAESSCQSNWNKLWGKSRCGYLNQHHQDSDRFAWRRHLTLDNQIELSAYSYDKGVKPYPNNPVLLKPFGTLVQVNTTYGLRLQMSQTQTIFSLSNSTGGLLEQQTVIHANHCSNFAQGYKLGLYFGGGCPAPSRVDVCYE